MNKQLLEILRCPRTRTPLRLLDKRELKWLNQHIASGHAVHVDATPLQARLQDALVTLDGSTIYPVRHGVPILLVDAAIATESLPGAEILRASA